MTHYLSRIAFITGAVLLAPRLVWAQGNGIDSGDTAWMLTASVLVLFMTIPGLSLFYAGLVRSKNVLSVMMQCFAITCMVTILWTAYAYGLAFGDGGGLNAFVGGGKFFLSDVGVETVSGSIPESVFQMFQLTFAIITPALIVGAFAERMKFSAMMVFMALWLTIVYAPVAHWVWGGGWLGELGVLDFAGGTVVHINAGVAALVLCLVIGRRQGPSGHADASQQPRADRGGRLDALGRVVRVQRRQRAGRRRRGRHGDGGHSHRHRHRRLHVDDGGVADPRQAERAGNRHRRRRRARGDYARVRDGGPDRRPRHRRRVGRSSATSAPAA